ncbi:MAG: Holliday junction resolvase RuvX [Acutalibacteraceae bacterium]
MRILAVDLGLARTGLAISDESGFLASPVCTVNENDLTVLADKIAAIANERQATEIVVGHPKNMDGSRGESAQRAEEFANVLAQKTGLPVKLWDERMTTVSAIGVLNQTDTRGKKRKAVIDTVAATIILQNYLDSLS